MAESAPKPSTTSSRGVIALWVIGASALILTAVSVALIFTAADGTSRADAAEKAFTMLVPLVGTWVGTVIAYYFSGDNFQRASDSVSELVTKVTDDRLRTIIVRDAMTKRANITAVELAAGDDGAKVNLQKDVLGLLTARVTRVPVLDDQGRGRFVIHDSLLYKFKSAAADAGTFDPAKTTLKDFLDFGGGELRKAVSALAYVGPSSTLAEAKSRMESIPGCQDVYVTDSGDDKGAVVGWLTNTKISSRATA